MRTALCAPALPFESAFLRFKRMCVASLSKFGASFMAAAVPIAGRQAGGGGRLLCWLLLNHHLFWEIGAAGAGAGAAALVTFAA